MGQHPQLTPRRGMAMVSALFGLVVVSLLAAGVYNIVNIQQKSARNREYSAKSLLLAEAAAAHAVALLKDTLTKTSNTWLLRGFDNALNTADDGYLIDHDLSNAVQIPAAGRVITEGTYTVRFRDDDDGDGNPFKDSNMRIFARCSAATPDSSYATIDVVVSGVAFLPGFASQGNITTSGNPVVRGACGEVHANGNLLISAGGSLTSAGATATGSVTNPSNARDTTGAAVPALPNRPEVDIPTLTYAQFCPAQADFVLRASGYVVRSTVNPVDSVLAISSAQYGWRRTSAAPVTWTRSTGSDEGFTCVEGNVAFSGNLGAIGNPLNVTVVATGSIAMSGTPVLAPATPDGILFVAGGDLAVSGNANSRFEGLMYGNSQCSVAGNPELTGQMVCRDQPNVAGQTNPVTTTGISGSPQLNYSCGGYFGQGRRLLQWVQRTN